ncbi:hypothetical protein RRG08_014294 [Elysia crispata]|uniref:Uncharacterized protein n=1 Tax=Elysia crispata TaxID=231223 RepID=A0AAE1EBC3_9GAST|nr:hypothetical protein RRG08_014294 [Elysia crispata]
MAGSDRDFVGTIFCSRETGNVVINAEKGDHGYIVSGGYPAYYSTGGKSGLWCQAHIRVCSTCKVKVTFDKLSFAECPSESAESERDSGGDWCRSECDHIHLFEVDTPYDRITHRDYFAANESDHYSSISGNIKIQHCVGNTSVEDEKHFKIGFTVLEVDWEDRPNVSCSEIHPLKGGGILSFAGSNTLGETECPGYFDFRCARQFCIDHDLMCDGVDHCGDGSDESPVVDCAGSANQLATTMRYLNTGNGLKPILNMCLAFCPNEFDIGI